MGGTADSFDQFVRIKAGDLPRGTSRDDNRNDFLSNIFEKSWPLLAFYPPWAQTIFMLTLACGLASIFVFLVWHSSASAKREGLLRDTELARLAKEARSAREPPPYLIESVTMVIRVEQDGTHHEADVRTTYTLFALKSLKDGDFVEEYHVTSQGPKFVAHLAGSDLELLNHPTSEVQPGVKRFVVPIRMSEGERRTVVTGARFVSDLPLKSPRRIHGFADVGPNEDAWCYPNHSDFIGEFILFVESTTLKFKDPSRGDAMVWSPNAEPRVAEIAPTKHESLSEGISRSVVVGRWRNVHPTETVGLLVKWN